MAGKGMGLRSPERKPLHLVNTKPKVGSGELPIFGVSGVPFSNVRRKRTIVGVQCVPGTAAGGLESWFLEP